MNIFNSNISGKEPLLINFHGYISNIGEIIMYDMIKLI
jgi:hypothetical protein